MAAKKKVVKKSTSGRSEPPKPPKDTSIGKSPSGLRSQAEIARAQNIRQNDLRIREAKMDLESIKMADARRVVKGGKSQLDARTVRAKEYKIDAMERQSPQGSRYSPKTGRPSNIQVPRLPDKLSGRTVESGTRSMLEGIRGWMRGGGGLRSHGK